MMTTGKCPGGPEVTLCSLAGVFIERFGGSIYQLMRTDEDEKIRRYLPAGDLPEDSAFVVRTAELRRFEKSIDEKGSDFSTKKINDQIDSRSDIHKLLKALVHLNYDEDIISDLKKAKSSRLNEIKTDLENKGYSFDDKTLRKYQKNLPS